MRDNPKEAARRNTADDGMRRRMRKPKLPRATLVRNARNTAS